MDKKNNKIGAGETKKPARKSRAGLSMEYKSKTLAASFTKSKYEEDEYEDYGVNADVFEKTSTAEIPTAICIGGDKEKGDSGAEVDGLKNMDCLKNSAKAGAKVAEISSKTNWMKDKVSNLWSRKGKQEEMEKSDSFNKTEGDQESLDNLSMSAVHESSNSTEKSSAPEIGTSPVKEKREILEEPSVEIKDGGKDKRPGRATTGWIRDQVSSLITKGKSYASSGTAETNSAAENMAGKSPKQQSASVENKEKKSSLAQSISEHYNLKQKTEGEEEVELSTKGTVSINFSNTSNGHKEMSSIEKDKFLDIHESINKSIAKQTTVAFNKDDQSPQNLDDRPSSPQVSSSSESKKPSAKSKIKGFLTSKPLTTDLTHIPLSPSSKDEKTKNGSVTAHTQTKMKFKFAGKLSFSELLQSQEHGSVANRNEIQNNESLSSSPVLDRFEEPISEEEDDGYKIDVAEKDETGLSNQTKSSTTFFRLWNLAVLFYALSIIPINAFIRGIILGSLVTYLIGCLVIWLFCPSGKSFEQYRHELKKYLKEEEMMTSTSKPIRSVDPVALRKPRDLKVLN